MLTHPNEKRSNKSHSSPLNGSGEPIVCSPTDALNMLNGSEPQFLIMKDVLVKKSDASEY
jgi:hypothetical protein